MSLQTYKGKIVAVTANRTDSGKYIDTLIISYKRGEANEYSDFLSPPLRADDIRLWRKIMLKAILGRNAINDDIVVNVFKDYKAAIYKKDVYVVPDEKFIEILGIGKTNDNIFYPDAYGAFDDADDDEEEIFE